MVSPTSEVLHDEIQHKAQSTHQAGKTAQVKHEEEYANSIAPKRRDNQARPCPWPARSQGRYHHCGDFEGHRMAAALGAGLLRRDREEELGLTLESETTKSGRIYRIVGTKTSAPSPSASGSEE